jgi:hypothetical protein
LSAHVLGKQLPEKVFRFYNEYKAILDWIVVSTDEMHASEKVIPTHAYSKVGTNAILENDSLVLEDGNNDL